MHQYNEYTLFSSCILHFFILPELIICLKAKKGSNTNVQILGHKKPLREAQISEKMHKKFYMMVIKLLLRFLKHKMVKLKPNKKRGENMRSVVENLNYSGILQKL